MSVPAGDGLLLPKARHLSCRSIPPNGKPEQDQSEIAMKFATKRSTSKFITIRLVIASLYSAGKDHSEATADMYLSKADHDPQRVAHMHLLGRDVLLTATLPDGSKQELSG